ncbi:hypothetical protein VZT92_000101 [Zoarces viviparus]|uniref:C-type lectin domain-containing protein n=1 Tax=Zoarces viviparus TaxID=48416 RepID=A0AAW1G4J8_ZOAVI
MSESIRRKSSSRQLLQNLISYSFKCLLTHQKIIQPTWYYWKKSKLRWKWAWTNGDIEWNRWADNEPDDSNDCAAVAYSQGPDFNWNRRYYTADCEERAFFFCEKSGSGGDEFMFLPESKTWAEARQYCQSQSADLASLQRSGDVDSAVVEQDFPVWTGLHRKGGTWKWSSGLSEYRNWAPQEPSNRGNCVSISSRNKTMSMQNCNHRFPVVCFRTNLVLVKENKTWEEALEHCRALGSSAQNGLRYELVSVQPGPDHEYVTTKVKEADTEEVWAGLRFLAGNWLWMNGATLSFPDLPLCPPVRQHCGALSKNATDGLLLADCSEERNFLCYSTY